jgi:hypothetical protein
MNSNTEKPSTQFPDPTKPVTYHRVNKDVDSNVWWWATCHSENEAENLVTLLNGYEKQLAEFKSENEILRELIQLERAQTTKLIEAI